MTFLHCLHWICVSLTLLRSLNIILMDPEFLPSVCLPNSAYNQTMLMAAMCRIKGNDRNVRDDIPNPAWHIGASKVRMESNLVKSVFEREHQQGYQHVPTGIIYLTRLKAGRWLQRSWWVMTLGSEKCTQMRGTNIHTFKR